MKYLIISIQIVSFVFVSGCSPKDEPINRILYNTGQGYDREQCLENPTADCGSKKNYDQYKREREELLKAENPVKEVSPENQALRACPYPGETVNWALRYCAAEYQTDDEIFLQASPCFENARAFLNSKMNACKIKEMYKQKYCEVLVKKYRTRESVTLCLEDHSVKPFFTGK
jgi:hypothetical protein